LALAASPGSTSISASLGTVSSSPSSLTVSNANLLSISVTPAGSTVPLATSQQFVANGSFDDGTQQNISETAHWTSSNPTIARISSVGVVAGIGLGIFFRLGKLPTLRITRCAPWQFSRTAARSTSRTHRA
jgi:hypothetical protein